MGMFSSSSINHKHYKIKLLSQTNILSVDHIRMIGLLSLVSEKAIGEG